MTLEMCKVEPEVIVLVMLNQCFLLKYSRLVLTMFAFCPSSQGDITSIPELADYVKVFK